MTTQDTGPDELTAQQETWQRLRDAHHIPHADSNCADIVMTLVVERIRLQRELATAADSVETWRSLSGSWQRTAERHRADSQRHEDLATELRKHLDRLAEAAQVVLGDHDTQQPDEWHLGDPEPSGWPMHVIGSRSSRIWTREHRHPGGTWLTQTPDEIRRETWEDLLEAECTVAVIERALDGEATHG